MVIQITINTNIFLEKVLKGFNSYNIVPSSGQTKQTFLQKLAANDCVVTAIANYHCSTKELSSPSRYIYKHIGNQQTIDTNSKYSKAAYFSALYP